MKHSHRTGWRSKFVNAFRGIALGVRRQNSFAVHIPVAVAVMAIAVALGIDAVRFSVLLLCIATVISAELFNTAIECLARRITCDDNIDIGEALDLAAGAVLCVSIGSAAVGVTILLYPVFLAAIDFGIIAI